MEDVEWTDALYLQLIREYRQRPALWDRADFYFYKKNIKLEIWAELGKVMNIDPEICRLKIARHLMPAFRREKAKFLNSIKGGTSYKSSWFGFEAMSFLFDRKGEKKRKLMVTGTQNTGEDDDCLKNEGEDKQSIALSEPGVNYVPPPWAATPAKTTKIQSMTVPEPNTNDIFQLAATPAKQSKIKSMKVPEPDANDTFQRAAISAKPNKIKSIAVPERNANDILQRAATSSTAKIKSMKVPEPDANDTFQWAATPAKPNKIKSIKVPERNANDILQQAVTSSKKARISVRHDLIRKPKPEERLPASPPKDCIASQFDDEINNFSRFIASKMMNYSTKTKNAVQREICKVINKADANFYEKQKSEQHKGPRKRTKSPGNVCEQQPSSSGGFMKLKYSYFDWD